MTGAHAASRLAGRLGMWIFLFADAMMFAALVSTYAMLRALATAWPAASSRLNIPLTGVFTFVLICSSVTMVLALEAARNGRTSRSRAFLALTMLGGIGFLGFQSYEWHHFLAGGAGPRTDLFYACFFALTGFHGFHVLTGLGVLAWMLSLPAGRQDRDHLQDHPFGLVP
jgi:heme/copper-type cytochrome/quinol oxidase subunit 3